MEELFQVTKKQLKTVTQTIMNAFNGYPLYSWIIPDEEARERKLPTFFKMMVRYHLKYGKVYATSENCEGVITFLHTDSGQMTTWRMFWRGGFKLILTWGKYLKRLFHVGDIQLSTREKYAPQTHIYLTFLVVDPQYQGSGLASQLLRPLLRYMDNENLPCYLETFREINVEIYKGYGFQLLEKYPVPDTTLTMYPMLRQPSNSS